MLKHIERLLQSLGITLKTRLPSNKGWANREQKHQLINICDKSLLDFANLFALHAVQKYNHFMCLKNKMTTFVSITIQNLEGMG